MLDLALSNHGLVNTADVRVRGHSRNIKRNFERDFSSCMDTGRNVYVHAHVKVLELRINQRVNTHPANAGLE